MRIFRQRKQAKLLGRVQVEAIGISEGLLHLLCGKITKALKANKIK